MIEVKMCDFTFCAQTNGTGERQPAAVMAYDPGQGDRPMCRTCAEGHAVFTNLRPLPDAPAPEGRNTIVRSSAIEYGTRSGSHIEGNVITAPEAKPEYCAVCDRGLECREHAPEAKPAVCGAKWKNMDGVMVSCTRESGHDPPYHSCPSPKPQPTPPPAPAPYACDPGCTPLAPCLRRNSDGDDGCPAWFERDIDGNMSFYRRDGISPDLPPARSYPAGEFSWSGAGATACRMTGRR